MSVTFTVSTERCRVSAWKPKSINGLEVLEGMLESKECRGISSSALGILFDILFEARSEAAGTSREEGLCCFPGERDVEYLYTG